MNIKNATPGLTKSTFLAGCQCLKRLYFQVHEPQLTKNPVEQLQFRDGQKINTLARQLFPDGILAWKFGDDDEQALRLTMALIEDGSARTIFEAMFHQNGITIRVDILHRLSDQSWQLIDVKSSSTVKDEHVSDVAIQKYVLKLAGLNVTSSCVMHVNTNYTYSGHAYKLPELFSITSVNDEVDIITREICGILAEQKSTVQLDAPPDIRTGTHCEKPRVCEFYDRCNTAVESDHILNLPLLSRKKIALLEQIHVKSMRDIPGDFDLSERQRRIVKCIKSGQSYFSMELKEELEHLRFPLFYMDFETWSPAIPLFAGMRPYNQIPFQWSVHVETRLGAELSHEKFLADGQSDPRIEFIETLLQTLERRDSKGVSSGGHIVVFSKFESTQLKKSARWFPQYEARLNAVENRLWDLFAVIKEHVYHQDFKGSYSIKTVLPALVPDMTYKTLAINNGTAAAAAFTQIRQNQDTIESNTLKHALLEYCEQDTLAMYKLLNIIRDKAV